MLKQNCLKSLFAVTKTTKFIIFTKLLHTNYFFVDLGFIHINEMKLLVFVGCLVAKCTMLSQY